jgi:hypothetical protein
MKVSLFKDSIWGRRRCGVDVRSEGKERRKECRLLKK